jgi:hypothetical protein
MQWKWGEHHRYHILCNGKGMNIINIIFYGMEKEVNIIHIIFYGMEKRGEHHQYHILWNGKRG